MTTGFAAGLRASDVAPGTVVTVMVDGRSVCVGHTIDGRWDLGDGELEGDAVECPRHGGRFNLFTGRVLALPPVVPVKAFPVHVEGDEIVVELS
jgi:nitrite reductase/ring-hydroxylating ferredoxin subunit